MQRVRYGQSVEVISGRQNSWMECYKTEAFLKESNLQKPEIIWTMFQGNWCICCKIQLRNRTWPGRTRNRTHLHEIRRSRISHRNVEASSWCRVWHLQSNRWSILDAADVAWEDDEWTVVTMDGSLSAHYENTILITDGEPEILTLTKWQMTQEVYNV